MAMRRALTPEMEVRIFLSNSRGQNTCSLSFEGEEQVRVLSSDRKICCGSKKLHSRDLLLLTVVILGC